jgi:hypothetical protein
MTITALIGTKMGVDVHKEGCKDLNKGENSWYQPGQTFESVQAMFDELLDTGDESNPGWVDGEFKFFPCTND